MIGFTKKLAKRNMLFKAVKQKQWNTLGTEITEIISTVWSSVWNKFAQASHSKSWNCTSCFGYYKHDKKIRVEQVSWSHLFSLEKTFKRFPHKIFVIILRDIISSSTLLFMQGNPFRILESECPLTLSQSWHMMKNQKFSYSSQR